MEGSKLLEQYYNEHYKQPGDPDFNNIPEDYKKGIKDSHGFAYYKLQVAVNNFGKEIIKNSFLKYFFKH